MSWIPNYRARETQPVPAEDQSWVASPILKAPPEPTGIATNGPPGWEGEGGAPGDSVATEPGD